jgi:hypothetical protein
MSIDIHAFVEASVLVNGSPICVESIATVHMQCDLQLFSLMAGAGSQAQALYPARGLPEDAGEDSRGAIELIVVDELTAMAPDNACTRKEADLWVKKGASRYLDASRNKITDPDVFNASWLLARELEVVGEEYQKRWGHPKVSFLATVAMMRTLDEGGRLSRLVFWFTDA